VGSSPPLMSFTPLPHLSDVTLYTSRVDLANLSDGAAALVGSLGLVPSINAGDDFVMGEP